MMHFPWTVVATSSDVKFSPFYCFPGFVESQALQDCGSLFGNPVRHQGPSRRGPVCWN